ncbi:kynureninase [Mucilaginibacter polytrichastri]|uniref:Kynureninase n=1 Tax=Mucilaginibacter polytrichastri TaxID=1302689 RepID=A0A1Q5ZWQ7_9SPHI|nr:kynureninase [Mucilaginibacter polytrichastri]OKS86192.1 Kynureninase [Mucilaginibacter polytrichastri]SFT15805.1 Kynureninase [Mucilaginibacter polytrichastri]
MNFENSLSFAQSLDASDQFRNLREEFYIPQHKGNDAIYLCGNSLGLQPKSTETIIMSQLAAWRNLGVEGWFEGDEPWLQYHKKLIGPLAKIVGAQAHEIAVMNSLTVNLHLLMVSFYKPTSKKYKILMEAGAFPSDQYAVESQVKFHGFELADAIIEIAPREGEYTLRIEDIIVQINANADEVALVLFAGINYYTGQIFDMKAITAAGHQAGAYVGFDLAHAAGNVPLSLHEWGADFACWCSYKYMNSGPGGISGIFVHEKHHHDTSLDRFAGWWGYKLKDRFKMTPGFQPEAGAEGWQVSTSPILLMASLNASLQIFEKAGSVTALNKKSILLTAYLEYLIKQVNKQLNYEHFKIITPANQQERGSQLSLICKSDGKAIFDYLVSNGVIGDWREPDVIRLSPVPLYNSFEDVYQAAKYLLEAVKHVQ